MLATYLSVDEDLKVVEETLLTLNALAHHDPLILENVFYQGNENKETPAMWALLYDHLRVKKELKRSVNLGPFKQRIDDGLVLRKAGFTCMSTMFKTMPFSIDIQGFMPHLVEGFGDKDDDIKILCHHIAIQLCDDHPQNVLAHTHKVITLPCKKCLFLKYL